jgi:hypothetical protein
MSKFTQGNVRALIRSVAVLVTAFGLRLSGEQVAAIQLVLESVMRIAYASKERNGSAE